MIKILLFSAVVATSRVLATAGIPGPYYSYSPVGYPAAPKAYAPAPYAYVKPVPKPAEPVEYVVKPSYETSYSYPRSHIPIQEETYDIPEDNPKPAPASAIPAAKLFVPVTTTIPPTTTTPAPTAPPPAYQPYAPAVSYYSPPASAYYAPTPAPAPAPTPGAEVYVSPLVSEYAPLPLAGYENNPYLRHVPVAAPKSPSTTTSPPTTPAPPKYVETYFIPKEPAPVPVVHVKPAPVVIPAPLPAVVATPIRSQFHSQNEQGQYAFGYANELSSKAEIKTADGITQGHYSYVDANGEVQTVHYVSDDQHGFRVAATNLPKASVPAHK